MQYKYNGNSEINAIDESGDTLLTKAIKANDPAQVEELLTRGANPNLSGPEVMPPLILATVYNLVDIVKLLLKQSTINVNQYYKFQATTLWVAAHNGCKEIMDELLKCDKLQSIDFIEDGLKFSPLFSSILNKHYDIALSLIDRFPGCINQTNATGAYPLHAAVQEGCIEVVRKLLEKRARFDVKTWDKDQKKEMNLPLAQAASKGYFQIVELLLQPNYVYLLKDLKEALHCTTVRWIESEASIERQNIYMCTELIKTRLGNDLEEKLLTLENYSSYTWDECYEKLFDQKPKEQDKAPKDKNAAIRKAIASMFYLLYHPQKCLPYLQFLSEELDVQWKIEHGGAAFPKFDDYSIELKAHQGNMWPIPKEEQYPSIKKDSLLDRLLLAKFKQYGMGETQTKWTGFVPRKTSKDLLYHNGFFNENRCTISGLLHGNLHNLQRVIMLYAMEDGQIPLSYLQEDGTLGMIAPKEVFSAFMRNDIYDTKAPSYPLWMRVFDSYDTQTRFTLPHCLHAMILTNKAIAGTLQEYMRFSFSGYYNKMRELFNRNHKTEFSNSSLFEELQKLNFITFTETDKDVIQLEKMKADRKEFKLETDEKKWAILYKKYEPLEKVRDYGNVLQGLFDEISDRIDPVKFLNI